MDLQGALLRASLSFNSGEEMKEKPFILGIIPARGGSKGLPGKNIISLHGKPLIVYAIEAAAQSHLLDDTIVSTDSEEIAQVVKEWGGSVPFMRPAHLATDTAASIDVVIHAIDEYELRRKRKVDVVVLLQPTAPFRTTDDIDQGISLFLSARQQDSLISCYRADRVHPRVMYGIEGERLVPIWSWSGLSGQVKRRQEFEEVVIRNGALYIASRSLVYDRKTLIGDSPLVYLMPYIRSINIDDKNELELAECLASRILSERQPHESL